VVNTSRGISVESLLTNGHCESGFQFLSPNSDVTFFASLFNELEEFNSFLIHEFPRSIHPTVIIATGYAEMIAEEDYHKARIDDVIRKPYAVADVLARANALIAARSNEKRETVLV